MSTKAIREALSDARASAVEWGMQNTVAGIDAAMAEVEAIERAARTISDNASVFAIQRDDDDAVDEAQDLLLVIAEGAPR